MIWGFLRPLVWCLHRWGEGLYTSGDGAGYGAGDSYRFGFGEDHGFDNGDGTGSDTGDGGEQ